MSSNTITINNLAAIEPVIEMNTTLTTREKIRISLEVLVVITVNFIGAFYPSEILLFLGIPLAILTIFFINRLNNEGWRTMGFRKPKSWRKLIWNGFLIALVFQLFALSQIIMLGYFDITGPDQSQYNPIKGNIGIFIFYLLIAWITAGFGEEVIWRGFVMRKISTIFSNPKVGWTIGIIISSIIFGLAHLTQGWTGVIMTATIAIGLGLIYIKTNKNIMFCIIMHGFMDTIAFTSLFIGFNPY